VKDLKEHLEKYRDKKMETRNPSYLASTNFKQGTDEFIPIILELAGAMSGFKETVRIESIDCKEVILTREEWHKISIIRLRCREAMEKLRGEDNRG